jgi:hypothetical protein
MKTPAQQEIRTLVEAQPFPNYHQPLHNVSTCCSGCNERRARLRRNKRAGAVVGVVLEGTKAVEPVRSCSICQAPCYAGTSGQVGVWAWNYNTDRGDWGLETHADNARKVPQLCPRCRGLQKSAEPGGAP